MAGIGAAPPRGDRLSETQHRPAQTPASLPHPRHVKEMKIMSMATASDVDMAPASTRPRVTPALPVAGCAALAEFCDWDLGSSLGPQSLPPVKARANEITMLRSITWGYRRQYETLLRPMNWRGRSFRPWRLDRYLAKNPTNWPDFFNDNGKG